MDLNIIYDNLTDKRYSLIYKETVSSTNVLLKEMAINGEKEFTVLIADSQTNGIGRKGNSFFSPEKTGVYMSILFRPEHAINHALLITPLAAVCCARAIEKISSLSAQIKWVNDIYVNNKKVCGVLAQSYLGESNSIEGCILGIGINVYPPKNDFPQNIKNKAGYLFNDNKEKHLREKLIAQVLNEFTLLYKNIEEKIFYDEYCSRSFLTGKAVEVVTPCESTEVTVLGIDNDFHLIVRLPDGSISHLDSGEVRLNKYV